jgi:hypothetical protein
VSDASRKFVFRTDLLQRSQIGHAISFPEYRLAILDHQHRATGIVRAGELREQAVDRRG